MKRGPKPLQRDRVYQATWSILEELTTINGIALDDWLMKLTPEGVERLQRPSGEKRRLSLDSWKRTIEGWRVFTREGQEAFEAWATQQTGKLNTYKKLQMQELLEFVEQRLGHMKTRKHSPKGTLLKYVQEAKDLFLMRWGMTWWEIPPALRHKRQPGFGGDIDTFYRLQDEYINHSGDKLVYAPFSTSRIN